MLNDYLYDYMEATEEGDIERMKRIERDLAKLGMDKYTLLVLVREKYKEEGACL